MADDKTKRAPHDAARINVNEEYEVRYWTETLGVSAEQLKELVRQHGVSAAAVRQALGKH
jgi:Protein of unknown function (DUF3606)